MPTLYQTEWCVWSHRVRQVMTELCVTFTCVNVPPSPEGRTQLVEISGQDRIPVLVDEDTVVVGSDSIIEHLRERHARTPYSDRQAAAGRFRTIRSLDLAQEDALARLRALLVENRLTIVSEARLPTDDDGTDYVLLQVAHEPATRRLTRADPATVGAMTIQIGLWPSPGGCRVSVADPVGGAWIAGLPYTIKTARQLRQRIRRVLTELSHD